MAYTFVGTSSLQANSGTVSFPAGSAAGDNAYIVVFGNSVCVLSGMTGWATDVASEAINTASNIAAFSKVNITSGEVSAGVGFGGSTSGGAVLVVVRDSSGGGISFKSRHNATSSTSNALSGFVKSTNSTKVLTTLVERASSPSTAFTKPTGFTDEGTAAVFSFFRTQTADISSGSYTSSASITWTGLDATANNNNTGVVYEFITSSFSNRVLDATVPTYPTALSDVRSTSASYVNSSGVVSSASSNVYRIDYDPVSLSAMGLLNEPAKTNYAANSSNIGGTGWNLFNGATVVSGAAGPDGNSNATTVTFSTTADSQVYTTGYTPPVTGPLTLSVWAKAGTLSTFRLKYFNGSTNTFSSDLTATSQWKRFVFTTAGGGSSPNFSVANPSTSLGGTILFWGYQYEQSGLVTSYIETVSVAVTRATDALSFTLNSTADVIRLTFDEGSQQILSGLTAGSTYTLPTSIARPAIKYIDDYSSGSAASSPFIFPRNRHYVRR